MAMHASLSAGGLLLLWGVATAIKPERPGPSGQHHHRLQVVVAGMALSGRGAAGRVGVDLLAAHGPPGNERLEGFFASGPGCQWPSSQV